MGIPTWEGPIRLSLSQHSYEFSSLFCHGRYEKTTLSKKKTFRNRMVFLVLFQFGLWRTSEGVLFPFVASSVQSVLRSVWVFCKWYVHCPSEPSIAVCGQLSRVVGIVCINTACYCGDNFSLCYCQPITVSALSLAEALFTLRYRNLKTTISLQTSLEEFENAVITGQFRFVFEENSGREIIWLLKGLS